MPWYHILWPGAAQTKLKKRRGNDRSLNERSPTFDLGAATRNAGEVLEHSDAATKPSTEQISAPPYSYYEHTDTNQNPPNIFEQLYSPLPHEDFAYAPASNPQRREENTSHSDRRQHRSHNSTSDSRAGNNANLNPANVNHSDATRSRVEQHHQPRQGVVGVSSSGYPKDASTSQNQNMYRSTSSSRRGHEVIPRQSDYGYSYASQYPYHDSTSSAKTVWPTQSRRNATSTLQQQQQYPSYSRNYDSRYPVDSSNWTPLERRQPLRRQTEPQSSHGRAFDYNRQDYLIQDGRPVRRALTTDSLTRRNREEQPRQTYTRTRHVSFESPQVTNNNAVNRANAGTGGERMSPAMTTRVRVRETPRPVLDVQREAGYDDLSRYGMNSSLSRALYRGKRYDSGASREERDRQGRGGRLHHAWDQGGRILRANAFSPAYNYPRAR